MKLKTATGARQEKPTPDFPIRVEAVAHWLPFVTHETAS
jgi:hypothetical protein